MIRIDRKRFQVSVNNKPVKLTPKEFDILSVLEAADGCVVSRQTLMFEVWKYSADTVSALETRTVDSHVAHLRSKLGRAGAVIKTVLQRGYRLDL